MTRSVAVVGAGAFGAWTAWHLRKAGCDVLLLDAHGPGNARSSSGGESRVIRMGYGTDELYTRLALRSLELWESFFRETGRSFLERTGVLWLAREGHRLTLDTRATLERLGVPHETLSRGQLEARFPQFAFEEDHWGVFEPGAGALMARRSVQAVVSEAVRLGCEYRQESVAWPAPFEAHTYVFACGAWLPRLFPELLGERIFPTRQEVFFFGVPPGEARFGPGPMPAWIDFGEEIYGLPDLEGRGFKLAPDRHGPPFDPETGERLVGPESVAAMRRFLSRRFPALGGAPLLETRVCQYENTSSGDFLIDRHPESERVWLLGGGSGHGFKHGPAVGEYVCEQILGDGKAEPRFGLASKRTVQARAVH